MDYARLAEGAEHAVAQALQGKAAGIAVTTSGSTGAAREVLIGTDAIRASAAATHGALHGPGRWLLAVPPDRIAGAMILARSWVAGTVPTRMALSHFTGESFAIAAEQLRGDAPRYTSLVPTQLARVLESPAGREALTSFDAVLVGGAPHSNAHDPGNVITSYGSTETSSGCVYNGVPVAGAQLRIVDGRVQVAGPMLADGYADGDNSAFVHQDGTRWFVTSDMGGFDTAGRLVVEGRADDVILSGGVNINPARAEALLSELDWVREAVVVGVPDPEWGERAVAVIEVSKDHTPPPWEQTRELLAQTIDRATVPRAAVYAAVMPHLWSTKIDRKAARAIAAQGTSEREV